jgi:hypothetical protein
MDLARSRGNVQEQMEASTAQIPGETAAEQPQPWEMIANGRYMPRRIRGSCRGRELG